MNPTKASEIIDLNIKRRSPQMPPDVLDALKLGEEALERLIENRIKFGFPHTILLPSETEE